MNGSVNKCTLKNKLPHYDGVAGNKTNPAAYDLYLSRKRNGEKAPIESEDYCWTGRYCDSRNDYRNSGTQGGRSKYKGDDKIPHCKHCKNKSDSDVGFDGEKRLKKNRS